MSQQEEKKSDNTLVFLVLWFGLPLAFVLLAEALRLPERFNLWLSGLW